MSRISEQFWRRYWQRHYRKHPVAPLTATHFSTIASQAGWGSAPKAKDKAMRGPRDST